MISRKWLHIEIKLAKTLTKDVEWNKCTLVTQNILLFNLFFQCIYLEPRFFFFTLTVYLHFFSKIIKYLKLRLVLFKMYLTTWKENKAQITQLVRGAAPTGIAFTPHRLTPERDINLGTLASITPGAALGTKHWGREVKTQGNQGTTCWLAREKTSSKETSEWVWDWSCVSQGSCW